MLIGKLLFACSFLMLFVALGATAHWWRVRHRPDTPMRTKWSVGSIAWYFTWTLVFLANETHGALYGKDCWWPHETAAAVALMAIAAALVSFALLYPWPIKTWRGVVVVVGLILALALVV